jgi:hypothetical protein
MPFEQEISNKDARIKMEGKINFFMFYGFCGLLKGKPYNDNNHSI